MIILATHNSGKIKEFKRNLTNEIRKFKVVDLKYFGISQVAEESGVTFEENAKQKLHYYYELYKMLPYVLLLDNYTLHQLSQSQLLHYF